MLETIYLRPKRSQGSVTLIDGNNSPLKLQWVVGQHLFVTHENQHVCFLTKWWNFKETCYFQKCEKNFLEKFKCEYFITKNVSYNSINIVYCLSSLNARKTCVLIYKSCLTISTNKSCLTISTKFVVLFEHLNARKTCVCFIFKSCFTTLTKLVKLFEYFKAKKHGRQLQLNLLCCLSISAQEKLVWSWHL